ncbi:MAG: tetratricopeptide repeat protein [Candidatus Aminicenantes bacterium]|nr:tetratricopeptide repeat protein [Candidatus Aminicenantes bacterium]
MKKFIIIAIMFISLFGCKKKPSTIPGSLKPGSPEYIMNQGIFYLNEGNIILAERKLLTAIAKKPKLEGALNALGLVYMYKREFEQAASYYKKLLALNPRFSDAYNSLGLIYTELNRYNLAKEYLLTAANSKGYRTPENAYVNLVMLELKHNKLESAKRYIDKAMDKNRNFAPIYNLKGIIANKENKFNEALANFKRALSLLTEEDANILVNMGQVYIKIGQKRKALDVLEKALTKTNSNLLKQNIRKLIETLSK